MLIIYNSKIITVILFYAWSFTYINYFKVRCYSIGSVIAFAKHRFWIEFNLKSRKLDIMITGSFQL